MKKLRLVALAAVIALGAGAIGMRSASSSTTGLMLTTDTVYRGFDTRPSAKQQPGTTIIVCGHPGAQALAVNLTVTEPEGPGYLSAFPANQTVPPTSNLNFVAGQTIANFAIVPTDVNGCIRVYLYGAQAYILVDIFGFFATTQIA